MKIFLWYFSTECALQAVRIFFMKQNLAENLLHGTQDGAKWNSAYVMVLLVEQLISDHGKRTI